MSDATWQDKVGAPNFKNRQEDIARAAMLAMAIVYCIGFVMGGLVCGVIGFLLGRW